VVLLQAALVPKVFPIFICPYDLTWNYSLPPSCFKSTHHWLWKIELKTLPRSFFVLQSDTDMSQSTTTPTADLMEGPVQTSDIEKSAETKKKISPTLISPISINSA
jgi:hypothetical protein